LPAGVLGGVLAGFPGGLVGGLPGGLVASAAAGTVSTAANVMSAIRWRIGSLLLTSTSWPL
jgi:hypothetical protein